MDKKSLDDLPKTYTNVPPANLPCKNPKIPAAVINLQETSSHAVVSALDDEQRWLVKSEVDAIPWSHYHAERLPPITSPPDLSALLPLFSDNAHSTSMMMHSMNIIGKATEVLNPGQIPVMTCDQPLYAICKRIQWCHPASLGEDHFVLILGGLHIELAISKMIGKCFCQQAIFVNALVTLPNFRYDTGWRPLKLGIFGGLLPGRIPRTLVVSVWCAAGGTGVRRRW